MPKLSDILGAPCDIDPDILGLTCDSRQVGRGSLFAALPGGRVDGRSFIGEAVARGAAAILAPAGTDADTGPAVLIADNNPRQRFARMAARYFAGQPAVVTAVTGTNGKTSVTNFLRQIWTSLGMPAASLGTIGLVSPRLVDKSPLTTPDPVTLHHLLATLAKDGVGHAALEASSHGLDQYRLDGVRLAAGAFTNLTRDHLDYHGDMDHYRQAKWRLFSEILPPGAAAVINADSPEAPELIRLCRDRGLKVLTVGRTGSDIRILGLSPDAGGQNLRLRMADRETRLHLPLAGSFQADNAVLALGLAIATGAPADPAAAALAQLEGVVGRLQKVATTSAGAAIYVDYAHTPDALETVLTALRPHAAGRLLAVFGCGGDRDPGKRPLMGTIAARMADLVFITDDNPRSEAPAAIRAQILAACPGAVEVGDRGQAIRRAVAALSAGDILVVAGKGHETGQTIAGQVLPFDDAEEVRLAVGGVP